MGRCRWVLWSDPHPKLSWTQQKIMSQRETHVSKDFNAVMNVMNTATEQELSGSDWICGRGGKSALFDPVLDSVKIHRCPGLLVPMLRLVSFGRKRLRRGDALVDEPAFRKPLRYGRLATLKAGPYTRTRPGFLAVRTAPRSTSIAGSLTSSDAFLLVGVVWVWQRKLWRKWTDVLLWPRCRFKVR